MAYIKRYEDSYLDEEKEELEDLIKSAEELYLDGQSAKSLEKWAKIIEIAEKTGNKDLYYRATERLSNIE